MNVLEIESPPVMELEEELVIPVDLSRWVPKENLRDWVKEIVNAFPWNDRRITALLASNPGFEPHALLATMVFAYATGVFGAEDIDRACSSDPAFRPVRPKLPPQPEEFTSFRKMNRGLIKEALAQLLVKAVKSQFIEGESVQFLPAGLRRLIVENAGDRLDYARHMDRTGEA
jgi:hypothetical protein